MTLKFNSVTTNTQIVSSLMYTVATNPGELIGYYLEPISSTNYTTESTSHLWMGLLNLGDTYSYNLINTPTNTGRGLQNSFLSGIIDSFGNHGALYLQVAQEQYRARFDGKTVAIKVPLNPSYTGMTSGLTSTVLYGAYVYSKNGLLVNNTSLCAGCNFDNALSDQSIPWTNDKNLGYIYNIGTNPSNNVQGGNTGIHNNEFESGITYLFSDDIYNIFTGSTGSSMSWSVGYGNEFPYSRFGKRSAYPEPGTNISDPTYFDRAVGYVNTFTGSIVLWDENLVNGFDYTTFTGSFNTGATPTNSGTTVFQASDMDSRVYLNCSLVIPANTITSTLNPTYPSTNVGCDTLTSSSFCITDINGNPVAVATNSAGITFPPDKDFIANFEVNISGGINYSGMDTREIITPL